MAGPSPGGLAAVAVRTAVTTAVLLVGLRATGKRQAGEGNLHDLMLALLMANAVQNGMTRGDGSLAVALAAAGTLLLLARLVGGLLSGHPAWEGWAVGGPTVLVEDGRVVRRRARREGVTDRELMAAVRDEGLAGVGDVKLAVLEPDGSISVIPRDKQPEA
ncbi:MAG TPA: YetF domain-containing protein [Gemmataceae bacterium]|jgi:uncharacterized membrane protein YcaP (DUF421 family)